MRKMSRDKKRIQFIKYSCAYSAYTRMLLIVCARTTIKRAQFVLPQKYGFTCD